MTGRKKEREGYIGTTRRGKVQSHVLWRMLGSRVKGEKCIVARERGLFGWRMESHSRLAGKLLSNHYVSRGGPPMHYSAQRIRS